MNNYAKEVATALRAGGYVVEEQAVYSIACNGSNKLGYHTGYGITNDQYDENQTVLTVRRDGHTSYLLLQNDGSQGQYDVAFVFGPHHAEIAAIAAKACKDEDDEDDDEDDEDDDEDDIPF